MHGDGGQGGQDHAQVQIGEQARAEDEEHHSQDGEDPDLDDGDAVQKAAHRRGGHHRGRQPAVQGHDGRLGEPEDEKHQQKRHGRRVGLARQDPACGEVERAGQRVDQDHRRQGEGNGRAEQVRQVFPACGARLGVLLVRHQRVGRQGQHLVEEIQREQVRGKRDADRGRHGNRERGIVARLVMLVQGAHVPDRVDRGQDPEKGRDQGEVHPHGIHPQGDRHPREDLRQGEPVAAAFQHGGQQGGDDGELAQGDQHRPGFPQVRPAIRQQDRHRPQQGNQDRRERPG